MKRSSRSSVSRETGVSPNALARSAACGLGTTLPVMGHKQGQGCWGHAIDPAGLADGLWSDGGQLLTSLVRKPLDPRIVETLWERQTLIPPEGRNVSGLAIQIDV